MSDADIERLLNVHTLKIRERDWFNNIAENLPAIRVGKNLGEWCDPPKLSGGAIVLGAGPSLKTLPEVLKRRNLSTLSTFYCDRVWALLRGAKNSLDTMGETLDKHPSLLNPDFIVSLDASPQVADFYTEIPSKSKFILNIQVHPSVARKLPADRTYWFIPIYDDPFQPKPSLTRALHYMTGGKMMAESLGNVGSFAVMIAHTMGCSPIHILGVDFSYGEADKVKPEDTLYWRGTVDMFGEEAARAMIHKVKSTAGLEVVSDPVFEGYARLLNESIKKTNAKVINHSSLSLVG